MIINSKISKHWEFPDGLVNCVAWPKKKKISKTAGKESLQLLIPWP